MTKFKRGDVVTQIAKLNSGGPKMTIRGPHFDRTASLYKKEQPKGYLDCVWFQTDEDSSQPLQFGTFHEDELTPIFPKEI